MPTKVRERSQCVLFSDEHLFLSEKPKEEKGKEGRDGRDGTLVFLLAFFSALMETGLILIWIWIGLAIRWERGAEDDDARRTTHDACCSRPNPK